MLKDLYYKYKLDYKDYILLIKNGNFYISLDIDANIIHNLFNYKILEEKKMFKIGFPLVSISKVCQKLDSLNINYIIVEKEIIFKQKFNNNQYNNYKPDINFNLYLNRINTINSILKDNIDNNNFSKILESIKKILCRIN